MHHLAGIRMEAEERLVVLLQESRKFVHCHILVDELRELKPHILVVSRWSDEQHRRSCSYLVNLYLKIIVNLFQGRGNRRQGFHIRYDFTHFTGIADKDNERLFRLKSGDLTLIHPGLHEFAYGQVAVLQQHCLYEIGRCSMHVIQRTEGGEVFFCRHSAEIRSIRIRRNDLNLAVT